MFIRCRRALLSIFRPIALLLSLCSIGLLPAVLDAQSTTTVTNVFQDHYRYGYNFGSNDCPAGYNIPTGQYPATYHLERGHAIHHADPKNATNDYWVYWAHFDNGSYGVAEVAIFKSAAECGPYLLQTGISPAFNTDGSGYGFQPGGWQSRDENIFEDNNQTYNQDGTVATYASAYLITASNDLGTQNSPTNSTCNYANDSMAVFKMTPDYLGIDATTSPNTNGANWVFVCAQREAPVMFKQGASYFIITSQAAGWYPSQGGYGVSANPLTGWTPSPIALGNTSTFGGQTSDGAVIQGTQATTYLLYFDHLGGDDSKNPASLEHRDTGGTVLPVILDGTAQTATLNWEPSFTVDNTTGVLTVPTLTNFATGATPSSTILSAAANPLSYAIDPGYATRWASSATGLSSFNSAVPTNTGTLCPVTAATPTTACNPSLILDVGSVQPIQEIDLSWYMVKGSEPYYTFKIAYSSDKVTWNTLDYTTWAPGSGSSASNLSSVPFSNNVSYGFNSLPVNFSARYVALLTTGAVVQNNSNFYGPGLFDMALIKSTAPASPQPATVTVTPSTSSTSTSNSFTVAVNVTGPAGQPVPSGYVQLSAPSFTSETYGLVAGSNSFTIAAGALMGGTQTLTVNFRPDPTSAPIYGIGTTAGTAIIYIDTPAAPANLALTQASPGAINATWTAAPGASSYILYRSSDGGTTYTQLSTPATASYLDTGLANDSTSYCYAVAAVNAAGTGSRSASACGTATANFPVKNIAVTPTAANVLTLTYTTVANATSYLIKRSIGGGAYAQLAAPTAASYADSGLTTGTNYCYTIAAVFSTGTAADSSPVCNTATVNFPVTGIAVAANANNSLTVTYKAVANVTGYLIKRSAGGAAYAQVATPTGLTYTETGLTTNVVYCYTVAAVFSGGTAPDSSPVCATAVNTLVPVTVANFSFETPATTSYVYNPTGASWTFVPQTGTTGSGVATNNSGFTSLDANAPLGTQIGFIQNTAYIYQTITGLTVGQTYKLIVSASQRQNKSGGQIGQTVDIRVDGTTITTLSPPQTPASYSDFTATFTATATSHRIGFYGTNTLANGTYPDNCLFIDNIRLVTYPPGAGNTPTPNYVWLVNSNGSLTRTDEQGVVQNAAIGTAGSVSLLGGVAIDANGGVWSVSSANNFLNFVSKSGTNPAAFADPSLNLPAAIAVDGAGTVWVANSGGNALSAFASSGVLRGTITDTTINGASGIAIDTSGNIWISNAANNTVDEVIGGAAPTTPLATATTSNTPGAKP